METYYIIVITLLVILYPSTLVADCVSPDGIPSKAGFKCEKLNGGICEKISVTSEEEDEHDDNTKLYLGTYTYLGMLNNEDDDSKTPIYRLDSTKADGYVFREWEDNNSGYNGWKMAKSIKNEQSRKDTAILKTDDCETKKPEDCPDWKMKKKTTAEKFSINAKLECQDSLGIGAIIGIVIAAILVLAIVAALGIFLYKKQAKKPNRNMGQGNNL